MAAGDELVSRVHSGTSDEAVIEELELLGTDERLLEEELEILAATVEHKIEVAYAEALGAKSLATKIAIVSLVVAALVGAALALALARGMAGGMRQMLNAAEAAATMCRSQLGVGRRIESVRARRDTACGRPVSGLLHIVSAPEVGARHRNAEADLAMKEKALARRGAPVTKIRPPFRASDELMTFLQAL